MSLKLYEVWECACLASSSHSVWDLYSRYLGVSVPVSGTELKQSSVSLPKHSTTELSS